ncbi:DUF3761 domain-containing protein [Nocardia alni]|uniref:DUF3761 domain-containing protein n=1 Tax=Nocardia alni TaxID=2815723 RepID=UPI00273997FE|nr:DUF3761 domain-containing protein [Nocardia alni]
MVGFGSLAAPISSATAQPDLCPTGFYMDAQGVCTQGPGKANQAPPGATAQCEDGDYSFSRDRSGT